MILLADSICALTSNFINLLFILGKIRSSWIIWKRSFTIILTQYSALLTCFGRFFIWLLIFYFHLRLLWKVMWIFLAQCSLIVLSIKSIRWSEWWWLKCIRSLGLLNIPNWKNNCVCDAVFLISLWTILDYFILISIYLVIDCVQNAFILCFWNSISHFKSHICFSIC